MRLIKLSRGLFAKVDDDDFDRLNQFKWYAEKKGNGFYARRKDENRKSLYMHRVIIETTDQVDHINHDSLDNQKHNLRPCSKTQNQWNKRPKKNGTSKYLGVHWDSDRRKWVANMRQDGKHISIGQFDKEEDAAIAYNEIAKKFRGEFANLNQI